MTSLVIKRNGRDVEAQATCPEPPLASISKSWPQNQQVSVNIDPTFEPWQFDAIKAAFINWNGTNYSGSGGNCSGVTFTGFTSNDPDTGNLFGTYKVEVYNSTQGTSAL